MVLVYLPTKLDDFFEVNLESLNSRTFHHRFLVGGIPTPMKNDGVRQIGSSSQLLGKS